MRNFIIFLFLLFFILCCMNCVKFHPDTYAGTLLCLLSKKSIFCLSHEDLSLCW